MYERGRGGYQPIREQHQFRSRRPIHNNRRPSALVPFKRGINVTPGRHTPRRIGTGSIIHKPINSVDPSTQRSNIQVVVRVRPQNSTESVPANRNVVEVLDEKIIIFDPKETLNSFYYHGKRQQQNNCLKRFKDIKFAFDSVYGPQSTNQQIFEGTIYKSLDTLIEGYNCSVFAYGATGSGKTFTMLGSGSDNPGLTYLTLLELYSKLDALESEYETSVAVSYLEVYNEAVRDLLDPNPSLKNLVLNIREDENGGVSIPNLTTVTTKDQTELLTLLSEGNSRRTQHPTDQNAESSRSHAVFQVHVAMRARFTDLNKSIRSAKLVMVDLAGSERATSTGCVGDRFREGTSINKSLLALGNCINALADGKKHIPYRDSKLTRLLKDSLGGNCKTVIIANVSPSSFSYDDTYNTLKYANRAKHIRVVVKRNEVTVSARIAEYTKVIEEMQERLNSQGEELERYKRLCKENLLNESALNGEDDDYKENINPKSKALNQTYVKIGDFKTLKRNINETIGLLESTESTLEIKKRRLDGVKNALGDGGTKGVEKLTRQLSRLEEKRLSYANQTSSFKQDIEEMTANFETSEEVIHVPLNKYYQLKDAQLQVKALTEQRDAKYEKLLRHCRRGEHLLEKSVTFSKTMYNIVKILNHNTKQNDLDFESLKNEYMGFTNVHWEDDENGNEIETPNTVSRFQWQATSSPLGIRSQGRRFLSSPPPSVLNLTYNANE